MDHVIYRDYIVNRRCFIYCSLTCTRHSKYPEQIGASGLEVWLNASLLYQVDDDINVRHILKIAPSIIARLL